MRQLRKASSLLGVSGDIMRPITAPPVMPYEKASKRLSLIIMIYDFKMHFLINIFLVLLRDIILFCGNQQQIETILGIIGFIAEAQ